MLKHNVVSLHNLDAASDTPPRYHRFSALLDPLTTDNPTNSLYQAHRLQNVLALHQNPGSRMVTLFYEKKAKRELGQPRHMYRSV
jgi:hypothetical protein